jgi:glycerol-3-phosphate dehydrogenase
VKRDLGALTAREHDLLVVGGGIHGAMVAWDAAQRGLSVALVEAADFGSGASWNSLKTVHGGLRHLQRADVFGLRESAHERRALLRIAPALVRPLSFLVPTYGHGAKGREALFCGLLLNDLLTADRNAGLPPEQHIPRGRLLSPDEVRAHVPGLAGAGLTGGALWTDAQVTSSERLLTGVLREASRLGAVLANHAPVAGLLKLDGRVVGAQVKDTAGGETFEVRARVVVLAAGAGNTPLWASLGLRRPAVPQLRAINLVLRRSVGPAVAVGGQADGRYLFAVPWCDRTMIGTDYAPASDDGRPSPTAFLALAARAFPWASVAPQDVALVHRGLVPGTSGASGLWTRSRVADHAQDDATLGLLSLIAVKYTTARGVAEAAVDRAVAQLGRPAAPCRTAITTLADARPLPGTLEEQARLAVQEEMARHLDDVLLRRLDVGTAGAPPADAVARVALVVARELGWSEERTAAERAALASLPAFEAVRG